MPEEPDEEDLAFEALWENSENYNRPSGSNGKSIAFWWYLKGRLDEIEGLNKTKGGVIAWVSRFLS